jgi:uncharacterized protein (TIGR03435 family)
MRAPAMEILDDTSTASKQRMLAVRAASVLFLTFAAPSHAQSQFQNATVSPPVYEYEVVSIKPAQSGGRGRGGRGQPTDGLAMNNVTIHQLLLQAFGVLDDQISGAPSWLSSERYDVNAKMDTVLADELQKLNADERNLARAKMMQALLADRLKLTFHRETKERSVYSLVVAKNGPKLQTPDPNREITLPDGSKRLMGVGGGGQLYILQLKPGEFTMMGYAVRMPTFATLLSNAMERPVLDRTELSGRYDITMKWTNDESGSSVPPTGQPSAAPASRHADFFDGAIFSEIQAQLGLKLEPGKGSVEIIVIDHIERPSGN